MEKTKSPKQNRMDTSKASKAGKHKNMHPESVMPQPEPRDRDDLVSTPHVDDDPESYRLT